VVALEMPSAEWVVVVEALGGLLVLGGQGAITAK
jgi:hypothetical protein